MSNNNKVQKSSQESYDPKVDKIIKKIGKDTKEEMDKLSGSDLRIRIVQANQAMGKAQTELEANPKYREHKSALAALNGGKRDLNTRQNALIAYALLRLKEIGQEDVRTYAELTSEFNKDMKEPGQASKVSS